VPATHAVAIDLGTRHCRVFVRGRGFALAEPSVLARRRRSGSVVSVGARARSMLGRTPSEVEALWPLAGGVIADMDGAEKMLRQFLRRARSGWWPPQVALGVPADATDVEKRAFQRAAKLAGARDVQVMEEPLAAAIGAGLPVDGDRATMVVDVGGGVTEAAVICLGGMVARSSRRVAGTAIDDAIATYLRNERGLLVGERTAEAVKIGIGAATPAGDERCMAVAGRALHSGLPATVLVRAGEVRTAIEEPLQQIIAAATSALDQAPPELCADISRSGVVLTGGTAKLRGLNDRLREQLGVPVFVASDPLSAVAVGAGRCLDELGTLTRGARRAP
jgi:rod shape-determining protein MreB